ncbi:MAG: hypothetical protein LBM60_04265 [Clostridium sp.]|nr:hypothetical protein [Clostridium sp.]
MAEKVFKVNPALTETAIAFDPQMPLGGPMNGNTTLPTGLSLTDGGKSVKLCFHAPQAQKVVVRRWVSNGPVTPMEKDEEGNWTVTIQSDGQKYLPLFFEVDDVYVLNPMAPIGWSHAHPINILDYEQEGTDYYLYQDVPHGTVARDHYYSKTCGCVKGCLVYTPPGYQKGEYEKLPVLYLQHGYGENESSWVHLGKVNYIMDNLLAAGKAKPCIIVMNNGMVQTQHEDGSRDWDALTIERMLIDDCIPYIEANYRVATDKWSRAMAGLSMGSMQTTVCTLQNPEIFGSVGIFSGFIRTFGPWTEGKDPHLNALNDKEKLYASYKLFFRCIGSADSFIHVYHEETALLKEKGVLDGDWKAYCEKIYEGGHDWNVWRPCVRDFLSMVFQ